MRMLAGNFPEFTEMLDKMDKLLVDKRPIDEKNYQFICFALSMREAAGVDDCWTHDVIGDWQQLAAGKVNCKCPT